MTTVGDVLKQIQQIKKELEYVQSLQEKWREQRDRFPKIYEGIQAQAREFHTQIEEMKNWKIDGGQIVAPTKPSSKVSSKSKVESPTIRTPKSSEAPVEIAAPKEDPLLLTPKAASPSPTTQEKKGMPPAPEIEAVPKPKEEKDSEIDLEALVEKPVEDQAPTPDKENQAGEGGGKTPDRLKMKI